MKRNLILILLIILPASFFFAGCDEAPSSDSGVSGDDDDNDDDDDDDNDDDDSGPTRSFYLASAPYQYEFFEFSAKDKFDFTGFKGQVEMASIHIDNFFGLPWDEFIAGAPLPSVWTDIMEQIRSDGKNAELGIYLGLTPLGGMRNSIAAKATEVSGELAVDTEWLTGCYNFDSGPDAQNIRAAFLAYVRWMVEYFDPDFLTHGLEINIYDVACPDEYPSLLSLLNQAYDQEKAINPALPLFPTFTASDIWYHHDTLDCFPSNRACMKDNLDKISQLKMDRFGISSYPIWVFSELDSWPEDYFTAFGQETGLGTVFGETGWNNRDVVLPMPTLADPCEKVLTSSDDLQKKYMEYLFEKADEMDSDLVVWWTFRDFIIEDVLDSCPCDAPGIWCDLYEAIYETGLGAPWLMWGAMGILDYEANPKPVKDIWDSWRKREISFSPFP